MVADIVAVLDALDVERAHYMGYSFGGWMGFGVAKYAPERLRSLILGGSGPYRPPPDAAERMAAMYREGMEALVAAVEERIGGKLRPGFRARILANDPEALLARLEALHGEPDLDSTLSTMTMPCLVYMAEGDDQYPRVEEWVEQMPNATFVSLPGLDHLTAYELSDLVLPHVTRFLERVGEA